MFTLIVYMFLSSSYYQVAEIKTIEINGFTSEEACIYAGGKSETASRTAVSSSRIVLSHEFICIRKDK